MRLRRRSGVSGSEALTRLATQTLRWISAMWAAALLFLRLEPIYGPVTDGFFNIMSAAPARGLMAADKAARPLHQQLFPAPIFRFRVKLSMPLSRLSKQR